MKSDAKVLFFFELCKNKTKKICICAKKAVLLHPQKFELKQWKEE
jgi:hypothetical protein